jgi:hypothetical protein
MDVHLAGWQAQGGHVVGECLRDRQQDRCLFGGRAHLPQREGLCAPVVDVGPARLDRERQAQRLGHAHGGRTIGIEELRIDHVERPFGVETPHQRQDGARDQQGIDVAGKAGDQREARMMHRDGTAGFDQRRFGNVGIAGQLDGWQADGVHHRHLPIAARGQRFHLPRDEAPETGALGRG